MVTFLVAVFVTLIVAGVLAYRKNAATVTAAAAKVEADVTTAKAAVVAVEGAVKAKV
jgi:hypothetical protein